MKVLASEQEEQTVIKVQTFEYIFFCFNSLKINNNNNYYVYEGGNCQTCREEEKFAKSEFCHYK